MHSIDSVKSANISEGEESPLPINRPRLRIGEVKDLKTKSSIIKAEIGSACQLSIDELKSQNEPLVNRPVFMPRYSHFTELTKKESQRPSLKQLLETNS